MDTIYPWLKGNKLIEPYRETTLRILDVSCGVVVVVGGGGGRGGGGVAVGRGGD